MNAEEFKRRTKVLALRVIGLVDSLPQRRAADVLGRQLLRSATSVGSNYRAACGAKSRAHFVSKLSDVEEEADETAYWLELLEESGTASTALVGPLKHEVDEILRMIVASIKTAKSRDSR